MTSRKYLNKILSMLVLMSFLLGNTGLVLAQETPSVSAPAQAVAAAPTSPVDETKVPHYFGPYPNWANSPQVLADAIVTIGLGTPTPVSFGNPLVGRAYATDYATPPGTLGPVFVVIPNARAACRHPQQFPNLEPGRSRAAAPRRPQATCSMPTCCAPPVLPTNTRLCMTAES